MELRIRALLLSLSLVLSSAGCIALARETYTSLRGPGAVPVDPADPIEVSPGRLGHVLGHDPSLARSGFGANASVTAAVCDWDAGAWFIVFPPLPIPLLSFDPELGVPGTTVVRVALDGQGTWRADLSRVVLEGAEGRRAVPDRYRLATVNLDESSEPCSRERQLEPRASVEGAELAVFGRGELWLRFPTLDWPDEPRALALDGLTLDLVPVPVARLEFDSGSRWFWYRVFP
jgi:hypothetical protein